MIRLHMVVEGQTEESFVNSVLAEHLGLCSVFVDVRCVETSRDRRRNKIYRGGLLDYEQAKRDLQRWMKQDTREDAYYTTMFDLYALPKTFPGFADAQRLGDPFKRVAHLESAFLADLGQHRFVPYIQLHEFEALILSDPAMMGNEFFGCEQGIERLVQMCAQHQSPELIDDGPETAPSKRIIKEIPEYEHRKASAGPLVTAAIGLPRLRAKCRHFNEWLTMVETLGQPEYPPDAPQKVN